MYLGISDGRRTEVTEFDLPGDRPAIRPPPSAPPSHGLRARLAEAGGNGGTGGSVTP